MKRKVRLLIVDDDPRVRELAEFAARQTDLFDPVLTAGDGQTALEFLSHSSDAELPQVVLTDLMMPRIDGLELARRIRENSRWHDIMVAGFSSSQQPEDEEAALAAGCRVFFPKPLGLSQLGTMMRSIAELAGAGVVA